MARNRRVQTSRPRQQGEAKRASQRLPLLCLHLSVDQKKILGLMLAITLVIALVCTLFLQGRVGKMQVEAEQLRINKTKIANENASLLEARAQVASKTQVAALAKNKLQLFEPDRGQVRRM